MSLPLPQSVFDMPVARQTRSRDLTRTRVWEANYKEEVGKRAGGSPSVEEKRPAFLANLEKVRFNSDTSRAEADGGANLS